MTPKIYPFLKNLRIALVTASVVTLAFGLTDIIQNKSNTMEVIAMMVLAFNLIYLMAVSPRIPPAI